jgi:hypothetical protein
MFKGSAPWDWSPDRVREDMRGHLDDCVYFYPAWEGATPTASTNPVSFDPVSRKVSTVRSGGTLGGVVSKSYGTALRPGSGSGGIDIGFDPLGGSSKFTVMAAVDLEGNAASNSGIIGLWSSGDTRFLWRIQAARDVRCIAAMSGGNADTTGLSLATSGLEIVTARFDGTTLNQYQNGAKSGSSATSSGTLNAATANWFIGGDKDGLSQSKFAGCVAGVMAWNRALPDEEISVLSNRFFDVWEQEEPIAPIFGDLTAPPAGAHPVSPFGHPLHGPFGGPI